MPEDPVDTIGTLEKGFGELAAAHGVLNHRPTDENEEAASIQAALRTVRRFYRAFFKEVLDAEVDGFGWEAKREAVAAMARAEPDYSRSGEAASAVGFLFEDICDVLHGDVDFGYTDDIDLLRAFGRTYLETWAGLVLEWLDAIPAANEVRDRLRKELKL